MIKGTMEPRRYPTPDEEHHRTLFLERRQFVKDFVVNEFDALHMRSDVAELSEPAAYRFRFSASVYAELDRRITIKRPSIHHRYPETWWDAFKVRWFPTWLLKRRPPKMIEVKYDPINIDEPVYKACYVNLPQQSHGGGITLFEVMKPDKAREYERELHKWRPL